jgi:3-methyladenine DNA glycosylase AlkD
MSARAGAMTRAEVLAWLKRNGRAATVKGMARYGIVARRPFGVTMTQLKGLQKRIGTEQALSLALWKSGWYEARLLAALVGDPAQVTPRQMNAWAASFENWADCDTACFALFDRTPHAWARARQWVKSPREMVCRGGFVLMACLALHDKTTPDKPFLAFLPLIERGAADERNFVMKGVSWALRTIGRRSPGLHAASLAVAARLAVAEAKAPSWVGRDALRELSSAKVRAAVERKARRGAGK